MSRSRHWSVSPRHPLLSADSLLALALALPLSLSLAACGDKDGGGDGADSGATGDDGGATGTDQDGDGYFSIETGGDDCDDANAAINPGATETCDLEDDDCDGEIDEGFDADGDGFYDETACSLGRPDDGTDCDDGDGDVYPGATEVEYDGVDQDCDGSDLDDLDEDGFAATEAGGEDCDDGDAAINPGATDTPYDGVDQDCSGADLVDVDEDGFDGLEAGGDDCDDSDPGAYPGAAETAYDGIDQDCDGSDLDDVDEDGFAAEAAGGDDCDDDNADVYPGAAEIPYDEADQDCDGEDLTDVDGDGYDSTEVRRGDDCDDGDARIHPGAPDIGGDGVDADCDDVDEASTVSLEDLSRSVFGEDVSQDYLGFGLAVCDLDADGLDDVIIGAPLADEYHGQLGIFYGATADSWSTGMALSDADAVIEGDSYFMGFGVVCGDFDGDGWNDLATVRGEINYTSTYTTDLEVLVWTNDGGGFTTGSSDTEATATFSFDLGAESGGSSVYSRSIAMGDIDGDSYDDLLVVMSEGVNSDGSAHNADGAVWVIPGGDYSGEYEMEEELVARIFHDQDSGMHDVEVVPDLDGDGVGELFFGQAGWDEEYDTGVVDTGAVPEGLAAFIADPDDSDEKASERAFGSLLGGDGQALGYAGVIADIDGDGNLDAILDVFYDDTAATYGGGVYAYDDIASDLAGGTFLDGEALADGHVWGESENGLLGAELWAVGDMNGDGWIEVMASQYGDGSADRWVILDGMSLFSEESVSDAAVLTLEGTYDATYGSDGAGRIASVGDIDGDGLTDLALSAYTYPTSDSSSYAYSGRVYLMLSTDVYVHE